PPRPRARGAPAAGPLIVVERLEVASGRGLVLRPGACLLVGAGPLAALGLAWLLQLGPRRSLCAAILAAGLAASAAHAIPLQLVSLGPLSIAAALAAGVASRLTS